MVKDSMNIYILGNGFDLHYSFPTKYANFLHTAQFLIDHQSNSFSSVGQVFGNMELQKIDGDIKRAYRQYKASYKRVRIGKKKLLDFSQNAYNNMWFSYLSEMLSANSGWIDVEKEIAMALNLIDQVLSEAERFHDKIVIGAETALNGAKMYIVNSFGFFWRAENQEKTYGLNVEKKVILDKYLIEVPKGSGNNIVDKNKIVNRLYEELMKLATLLKAYLSWFVDEPLHEIVKDQAVTKDNALEIIKETPVKVVSFNYTHTWEILYPTMNDVACEIAHIHGEASIPEEISLANDTIVLGINSDKNDELDNINTTFINFKKYYQRVIFTADRPYRHLFARLNQEVAEHKSFKLTVIGHSLDVTDKDIIKELFSLASSITVFYYDQSDMKSKVENLVRIYGDSGLLDLRTKKNLEFADLSILNS